MIVITTFIITIFVIPPSGHLLLEAAFVARRSSIFSEATWLRSETAGFSFVL